LIGVLPNLFKSYLNLKNVDHLFFFKICLLHLNGSKGKNNIFPTNYQIKLELNYILCLKKNEKPTLS